MPDLTGLATQTIPTVDVALSESRCTGLRQRSEANQLLVDMQAEAEELVLGTSAGPLVKVE